MILSLKAFDDIACSHRHQLEPKIARFLGLTRGPSGADRTQVGPILVPWTLLSGELTLQMLQLDFWGRAGFIPWLLLRRNATSKHDIDYEEETGPDFLRERISTNCTIPMSTGDGECKYMIMFSSFDELLLYCIKLSKALSVSSEGITASIQEKSSS